MAENIGIAGIIGAVFAGLAFAEMVRSGTSTAQFPASLSYWLRSSSLRLHLSVFTPGILGFSVVLSTLAILSKVLGCGLPLVQDGWRTMLQVGIGSAFAPGVIAAFINSHEGNLVFNVRIADNQTETRINGSSISPLPCLTNRDRYARDDSLLRMPRKQFPVDTWGAENCLYSRARLNCQITLSLTPLFAFERLRFVRYVRGFACI